MMAELVDFDDFDDFNDFDQLFVVENGGFELLMLKNEG